MIRNRTNSQKPTLALADEFKNKYFSSQVQPPLLAESQPSPVQHHGGSSLIEGLDIAQPHSRQLEDVKDVDQVHRGAHDPWHMFTNRLNTPSILDPNSSIFADAAGQLPGYYTPTPGGTNTIYHQTAGDLHTTPGWNLGALGLGTPLSLSQSEPSYIAPQTTAQQMAHFNPTALEHSHSALEQNQQIHFHSPNPFEPAHAHPHVQQHLHQQQTFAPQAFHHDPYTMYDPQQANQVIVESPVDDSAYQMDTDQEQSPIMTKFTTNTGTGPFHGLQQSVLPEQPAEPLRYYAELNAGTAMIKEGQEVPVSYLNKGQAYSLLIRENGPPVPITSMRRKYRTFVRISFDAPDQRARPGHCWTLWREGRGANEAHVRDGKLQAVEYVEATHLGGPDLPGRPDIQVESESFDGFAVTWSPAPGHALECSISLRFNFLSTDFSHSKGVKGIPVRLCAKTQMLDMPQPQQEPAEWLEPEVAYCKVKLFRDHGAERKLQNDTASARKALEKARSQLTQGFKESGKRKRTSMTKLPEPAAMPGKVPKKKRTWSASDASDRPKPEDDPQAKIIEIENQFNTMRPKSILYLRGEEEDDPDLHPVRFGKDSMEAKLTKVEHAATTKPTLQSPASSSMSVTSGSRRESGFTQPTPFGSGSRMSSNEWRSSSGQTATGDLVPSLKQQMSPPNIPFKVQRHSSGPNDSLLDDIEVLDVDPSYEPPPVRTVKPVASFFVRPRVQGQTPPDKYYRAIYLMQRTTRDFINGLASKCNIEPTQVVRLLRSHQKGFNVLLDDDAVREIPEAEVITAEFRKLEEHTPPPKREWGAGATDIQVDGDVGTITNVITSGYELVLHY